MITEVIKVNSREPEAVAIKKGASLMEGGQLIAFPTDTVYGLGADGFNDEAVRLIFKVKRRAADHPLVLLVAEPRDIGLVTDRVTSKTSALVERYWPGPLTLVVKKRRDIPDVVTAGRDTVGVRCPNSAVARALIAAVGRPLATTSANLSGHPSPTTANQVLSDLDGAVPLILDGGVSPIGAASTVLDMTSRPVAVLREGSLSRNELERFLGSSLNGL